MGSLFSTSNTRMSPCLYQHKQIKTKKNHSMCSVCRIVWCKHVWVGSNILDRRRTEELVKSDITQVCLVFGAQLQPCVDAQHISHLDCTSASVREETHTHTHTNKQANTRTPRGRSKLPAGEGEQLSSLGKLQCASCPKACESAKSDPCV